MREEWSVLIYFNIKRLPEGDERDEEGGLLGEGLAEEGDDGLGAVEDAVEGAEEGAREADPEEDIEDVEIEVFPGGRTLHVAAGRDSLRPRQLLQQRRQQHEEDGQHDLRQEGL